MTEIMKSIDISLLLPFENHPFKERSGTEQDELLESIKENGLLEPITVRFLSEGKYQYPRCKGGGAADDSFFTGAG